MKGSFKSIFIEDQIGTSKNIDVCHGAFLSYPDDIVKQFCHFLLLDGITVDDIFAVFGKTLGHKIVYRRRAYL